MSTVTRTLNMQNKRQCRDRSGTNEQTKQKKARMSTSPNVADGAEAQELTELACLEQCISVWGRNQETLEAQALEELAIFTRRSAGDEVEDGEIVNGQKRDKSHSLDIDSYLKRQEELRRIQEYRRTLRVNTNQSKIIAEKVTNKIKKSKRRKRSDERKGSEKRIKTKKGVEDRCDSSGSEYVPSESEVESDLETSANLSVIKRKRNSYTSEVQNFKDDGCVKNFKCRLEEYYKRLENERIFENDPDGIGYYTVKGGLKVPLKIWDNLYPYQQDGVRWLWNIHRQSTGGILGDEMGLGKTVQVIAFLAGLDYSQVVSHDCFRGLGPSLVVCPVTVISQWVKHFHEWSPEFRVAILHQSGSFQGNRSDLVREIHESKGVLVTSYVGVLKYEKYLTRHSWHYLILDEGHKIRNPNAKISSTAKRIRTPHRLMLTGSPMQNNLQELWSLFDFTNPGMLGNLSTFVEHFNNPIVQGGFANATPMQEATALTVATTLKDLITPYMLRRSKDEVRQYISLPDKSEQVLFCSLTPQQRELYKGFLMSDHVASILGKCSKNWFAENQARANVFIAITALRKICNHPDIYLSEADELQKKESTEEESFGYYKKSGKMIVVSALLKMWKRQKHRVLLFTQSRTMIVVLEKFLELHQYKYLKMDGSTSVSSRQPLISKFNSDPSYDVFLLTTRVGGLGVNLTGADRVIIYDPDWNPATDTQARERAWRIGQNKQVTIYRLLSAGTIEEKMYQRQIWKQILGNKVLTDPRAHKFFKSSSLHDLFSLPEDNDPETANIFRESRVKIERRLREKQKGNGTEPSVAFSEDKIQAMKKLAQEIARNVSEPRESKKSLHQTRIELEREQKLEARKELEKLTPSELLHVNRERARERPESPTNKVDDCSTGVSFSQALERSEQNAAVYHGIKGDRVKKSERMNKYRKKEKESKKKSVFKSIVDSSGVVEGEKVDSLVKTETKKIRKKYENVRKSDNQDEYILQKLFAKKGVSSALQHDSVVSGNVKKPTLKMRTEAKLRADKALEALRKSRLDSWRW